MDGGIICKFTFRCERKWDDLKVIDGNDKARYCAVCESPVYMSASYDELVENVTARRCVAIRGASRPDADLDHLATPLEMDGEYMGYVVLPSMSGGFDPILTRPVSEVIEDSAIAEKLKSRNLFLVGDLVQVPSESLSGSSYLSATEIAYVKEALAARGLTVGLKIEDWERLPASFRASGRDIGPVDDRSIDDFLGP